MGIRSTNKKYFSKTTTGARTKNFFARFRSTNAKTGSDGTVSSSPSPSPGGSVSATGGTTTIPGNGYKYHFFTSSGSFVVSSGGNIDFILVGGGGGGRSGLIQHMLVAVVVLVDILNQQAIQLPLQHIQYLLEVEVL